MTRQEFIQTLSDKLSEEMSPEEVRSELQYYRGYIDGEIHRGKTEEEVIEELGDPILIARTLTEAPRETTIFGTPVVQDQMDAYEEGAYQGGNSLSENEIQQRAEEGTIGGEFRKRTEEARESAEEQREALKEKVSEARESAEEQREALKEKVSEARENAEEQRRGQCREEKKPEESPLRSANGEFNWALFAVILAAVMIVVAVIWIIGRIVSATGPAILIILAIILIGCTIYNSRRGIDHTERTPKSTDHADGAQKSTDHTDRTPGKR